MDKVYEPLFTLWKIGNVEIKNRVVLTSMGGTNLLGWMEKPHFDKAGAEFILKVAENNVGLVLPGCQPVYNPMFGNWLYENKKMYEDLKAWMPELHKTGAKLFVQLTAGFGRSFTISGMMEMLYTNPLLRAVSKPFLNLDMITASASPNPNRWSDKVPSREMTIAEIQKFIYAFGESSKLLMDAGVDGVEVHAVHEGYLLDQFTLKYTNQRTDEYGGSFENRYRFPAEIVKAIKERCGADFPVSLRYSVISKTKGFREGAVPGEKYTEVGRDMAESEKAVKFFEDAGYDMLNCDNGTYDAWYWAHPPVYMPENCNLADVEHIKKFVDIPVVAAGRLDPKTAAKSIAAGTLDGAGFARPFLADQEWVTKLIEQREDDIKPCILCHNGCFNMCHYEGVANDQELSDSLHLARCAVNARTMQTDKHYIKKSASPKSIAVVGGGIGGMESALVLTKRGHKPTIFEKSSKLGGVFILAAALSYKDHDRRLIEWYRREIEKTAIPVNFNTEIKSVDELKDFDEIIIATGSAPRKLPVPGAERAIEATEYLAGKDVGTDVIIVGGGLTGCEIAYELILEGKKPQIVEMKNDLIAVTGVCLANSSFLREMLAFKKTPVYLNTSLVSVNEDGVTVKDKDGKTFDLKGDSVIMSVGYKPAPLAGKSAHVHLIGDANSVGNLRTVIWRAWDVCMKL